VAFLEAALADRDDGQKDKKKKDGGKGDAAGYQCPDQAPAETSSSVQSDPSGGWSRTMRIYHGGAKKVRRRDSGAGITQI